MTSDSTDPLPLRDLLANEPPDALQADESPPLNGDASALLRELGDRLDRLAVQFDDKIRADAGREAIVERLHAELQEYKSDLVLQVLKPLLLDLIALHDNLGKALEAAGEDGGPLRQRLEEFRTEVEDALYRQGVERYETPGDAFDPRRQQALKTLPAPVPELEGRVAERLRPGFSRGERVLRSERVVVFVKPAVRP
jgi:molecular chaperone GrpE